MEHSTRNKIRLTLEFLKIAGISGLVFIAFLVVAGIILGWAYQDKIKEQLLKTVNESLQTEVFIDDIRFDIFRSFPQAAISLRGVTIIGSSNNNTPDTLLFAQRAQLQFSLADIFRKKYNIKQIVLSQGFLRPELDDAGVSNYDLLKKTPASQSEMIRIDLQSIVLKKMHVRYRDMQSNHLISATIHTGNISGTFLPGQMKLNVQADALSDSITVGQYVAFRTTPLKLAIDMQTDSNAGFRFAESSISVNKNVFSFHGMVHPQEGGAATDMHIAANKLSITQLVADMPDLWKPYVESYFSAGELGFSATIQGTVSDENWPLCVVDFQIDKAVFKPYKNDLTLSNLSLKGNWRNDNEVSSKTYAVRIFDAKASVNNRGTIAGNGHYSNVQTPEITVDVGLNMPAEDVSALLMLEWAHSISGRITADISFSSAKNAGFAFSAQDLARASINGSITAHDLGFFMNNSQLKFHGLNGQIKLSQNNMLLDAFSGNAGNSDFSVSGSFRNFMQHIILNNQTVHVDATLNSRFLDFDELLLASEPGEQSTYKLQFSDKLSMHIVANVDRLKFRRFEAENASGTASLLNRKLYADKLSFDAMSGRIQAEGYIDSSPNDKLIVGCTASLNQVDIHQLFYQMGNFGQTSILDENIFGILTSDVQFSAFWSPTLDVYSESIRTIANVRINDGVLVDYEPLKALGRFIRADDLSRVRFSTLQNTIHIQNRNVHIPNMEINSNVLNLKLSGNHTFDNQIAYHLQLLLSEVLSRKNREQRNPQSQYGHIVDDGRGRTTLFLKVTGDVENPSFQYDFQGVREKLANDFRQQAEDLRIAFGKEFSAGAQPGEKTPEKTRTERQKEMDRLRKQEQGKMILEWEDF